MTPEPLPQSALEQAVIANLHQQKQQQQKKTNKSSGFYVKLWNKIVNDETKT